MALRFYLVPKVWGTTPVPSWRPQHVSGVIAEWDALTYGREDVYLVAAEVTDAEHTTLAAQPEVIAIPANLDATLSAGAVTVARAWLEARSIPNGWVTTARTSREVLGTLGRLFRLMQRFNGRQRARFFGEGITLGTRINQLSAVQRNALQDAARDLQPNLDLSGVTGASTLRQALVTICQQLPGFTLRGESF